MKEGVWRIAQKIRSPPTFFPLFCFVSFRLFVCPFNLFVCLSVLGFYAFYSSFFLQVLPLYYLSFYFLLHVDITLMFSVPLQDQVLCVSLSYLSTRRCIYMPCPVSCSRSVYDADAMLCDAMVKNNESILFSLCFFAA